MKETLYLALCPHCTEEELIMWEKVADKIAKILKREIKIKKFNNFAELFSDKQTYDFYYANPDMAITLIEKGYIVLGRLKSVNESLCSIISSSYNPEKDMIRVALINQKYFFLPILFHKKEYQKFNLIFVNSYEEIENLLREGKADIGFIYTQFSGPLRVNKNIKVSDDFCFPIFHFLLMHPSMEAFKDELLMIEDFESVKHEEVENLKALYQQLDILLRDWAQNDISEALITSPNIGVIIYHEKISFINEYAKNLLGYSDEEIYNMSSIDIIYEEDQEKVRENHQRRLKGEKFSKIYDIRFKKKDGSIVFVECLANTILFRGVYSGFIVFYDITAKKYEEKFKEILMEINKIITQALTEEEIYSRICKSLVEKLNLKFSWIGILDEKRNKIIPQYSYGDINLDISNTTIKIPSDSALIKGEILINSNLLEILNNLFKSSCLIPIYKFGKVISIINIYSEFPHFFNESVLYILKEIQHDISFALERVDRIRHNTIISEALKNSDTWILVTDENGHILYVNEAVERISGYTKEELLGKNPRIFKSGLNPPEFYKEMWDTILSGRIFNVITPNRKKNGEIFHVDLKIIPVRLPGNILRFVAVARDVTEKIRLSERIQRLQNYDALTGLLNLNGFTVNVSQKLSETDTFGVFILIDIYDMTYINKIHGIYVGDQILIKFADKIRQVFENTNCLARIAADTFGVYTIAKTTDEIYKNYSKLYELNNSIFKIENKTINININAAISIFPKDGGVFRTLYERTDITLQQAKKSGPGTIQFFDAEIEKEAEKLWEVFNLIKNSSEEHRFIFHYQPYYYTKTLKIAGFEALVRISYSDGKLYMPDFFIDYLENSNYIFDFEKWAIREVTGKIKQWRTNISINISGKTFSTPTLLSLLKEIPSDIRSRLTIEITERIFINNPEYTKKILSDIKKMDNPPKIAIDDFGTGYSSMIYLRDLPIDIVKIDKAFIRDMFNDKKSFAIVQTIVDLANRLQKNTLAEGVETEEQYEILKSIGCDFVQGYLFSKPLPEKDIKPLLE
ncbi:MAG: EAL domain-containing protein [Thermodesulfovibrio sp.]|nr:EAL domain-containing protein [Thermodesulfovibrio sp.]MDW7998040.1 EAL domain-containing protein [Thermodesulfovibrio sp.]